MVGNSHGHSFTKSLVRAELDVNAEEHRHSYFELLPVIGYGQGKERNKE